MRRRGQEREAEAGKDEDVERCKRKTERQKESKERCSGGKNCGGSGSGKV